MEISPELVLFCLIAVYLLLATILAFFRCRKYLRKHPDEKIGVAYYHNDERNTLTFAGFSLTALALLVGLQINRSLVLSSEIQFFSLAFALILMAFLCLRFRFVNISIYLSDVLLNAGLLSIGCGFLVFFIKNVSWFDGSTIIFIILVTVLFLVSLVNYIFFDVYSRGTEGEKSEQQKG